MSSGLADYRQSVPRVVVDGVSCLVAADNPARTAKWASVVSRMRLLPKDTRVVAASSGGHGCAVALAAQKFGQRATIVVPTTARRDRLELLRQTGCNLMAVVGTYEDCRRVALEQPGWFFSGFDDLALLDGHRWMFPYQNMTVPIGGGGLFAAALMEQNGEVIGIEHVHARAMSLSLAAEQRIYTDVSEALGPVAVPQVGALNYEIVRAYKPRIVAVTNDEVSAAQRKLWDAGVQAELAGALGLAGALVTGAKSTIVSGLVL